MGLLFTREAGTPQGEVTAPLLANIYLHEVLDEWFVRQVAPRLVGRAVLVRYADDVVIIFGNEQDARRVFDVLPKRFEKYGLTLHPEKTRLVDFRRPDRRALPSPDNGYVRSRPGTFDLLGFTHYSAKSRKGYWVVKQKTAADRLRRALKRIADWCRSSSARTSSRPVESTQEEIAGALWVFRYYRKLPGASQPLGPCRRCVAKVVEPPLATGMDIAGEDETAAGAVSAATAAYSHLPRHVAKPWPEEPDAGNPHVRIGEPRGVIPEATRPTAKVFGVSLHDLVFGTTTLHINDYPEQLRLARTAALYLCRKHTGLAAVTIARAFNRRSPAVAYAVRSMERLLTEEPRLGELLSEVEREFGPAIGTNDGTNDWRARLRARFAPDKVSVVVELYELELPERRHSVRLFATSLYMARLTNGARGIA